MRCTDICRRLTFRKDIEIMGQIKVQKNVGGIEGLCIIEPTVHGDNRGYFMETYNSKDMQEAGIDRVFVQDNQSCSTKGVLRGLHFQKEYPQAKLEEGLLKDEKELAEHNMLVDLGRNDLGKVSKFGTVKVEKLHSIERYSHVMHIGSTVRGEIREEYDALDAIEAVLPAGTLSGAPKIRACQLIGELEDNKRGIYGGAIGYIDFTGNMDTCIAIRIAYKKNGKVFVRSGAGIVADSDPEKEFQECINKAKASLKALEVSQEVEE